MITFMIGKVCVVRTYSAGVHVGEVVEKEGTNVLLKNSKRVWKWVGAFTLSELANNGVEIGSRIAEEVPYIELTQAIELIPMTQESIESLGKIKE